ncbi:PREDICTED: uncharacterized protein LOC109581634 [Amphimedon queenslandica]|uniref:Uncharacterized protein n=1 Tax=Amphimedon queenslandica TaxID=400682 RepID=A0AAN0J3Z8_AMPQE|nr:PREDICTED: uncharacterized protein LOC109581634 [Amphimedon queenslandica]|eukprot:XP_019851477.1 PREDICTED: uncharacterized protein LOC109581634 [Amphimedon queenslandica]
MDTLQGAQLRWYFDGSVQCFSDGHIPLAIMSIVSLLICIALVLGSFTFPFKFSNNWSILRRFQTSCSKTFTTSYWCGIELARRLVILIAIAIFPSSIVTVIMFLMVFLTLYGYVGPHMKKLHNFSEMIVMLWLIVLLMVSINPQLHETMIKASKNSTSIPNCSNESQTITDLSVLLAVLYYFPVVICLVIFCFSILKTKIKKLKKVNFKKSRSNDIDRSYMLLDETVRKSVPFTEIIDPSDDTEF